MELDDPESLLIMLHGEIEKNIGTADLGTADFTPRTSEDHWECMKYCGIVPRWIRTAA